MALVPNQRCTCGFNRFREKRLAVTSTVERWMQFDPIYPPGGFGATPFGTYFGGGAPGTQWGLFSGTFRASQLEVACESCSRVRTQKRLGGIAVFGGFVSDGYFYVVASDALIPITCYSLKVDGPGGTYEIPLSYVPGTPLSVFAAPPPVVAVAPPSGAPTVDTMLRAPLPEVPDTGSYTVTVVDRCCGCESAVAVITLEAPAMILSPNDADIGGAPRQWLTGSRLSTYSGQPAGPGQVSIPFDKCNVVIDYDARDGVFPDAQGWTRFGAGSPAAWSLTPGGALALQATAPDINFYEKAVTTAAAPTKVYAYTTVLSEDIPSGAVGSGFEAQAVYAAVASPYQGVRLNFRDNTVYYTELSGLAESSFIPFPVPSVWASVGGAVETGGKEVVYQSLSILDFVTFDPGVFGSAGLSAANELRVRFGHVSGSLSFTAYLRSFIAADGRFIRARFHTAAPVSAPKLRLYLTSDSNGSVGKTARFKVNYGLATGSPGGPLPLSVSGTVNMVSANTVYELPLVLPGLATNAPVWISLERDWSHPDDQLDATVHFLQATVRSS